MGATADRRQPDRLPAPDDDLRQAMVRGHVRLHAARRMGATVDLWHLHVPPRQRAPPGGEHAGAVRVRRARGGTDGRRAVPRVLPALRLGRRVCLPLADAAHPGSGGGGRVGGGVRRVARLRVGMARPADLRVSAARADRRQVARGLLFCPLPPSPPVAPPPRRCPSPPSPRPPRGRRAWLVWGEPGPQIGAGRAMLVSLVPEFLAVLAAPHPVAAYREYLDRHKPVLESYWRNYVLDPTSPHAEQVIAAALRANRADLERLLEDVDVAAIADDALRRSLERFDADSPIAFYLLVGPRSP